MAAATVYLAEFFKLLSPHIVYRGKLKKDKGTKDNNYSLFFSLSLGLSSLLSSQLNAVIIDVFGRGYLNILQ